MAIQDISDRYEKLRNRELEQAERFKLQEGYQDKYKAGASIIGSLASSGVLILIVIVLLFGGPSISLLQEIFKNVPIVIWLGVVGIIFLFKR